MNFDIPSKVTFVADEKDLRKHAIWRNVISSILGWWNIQYGVVNTINAIRSNSRGEWDVTADVMANITEESLERRVVYILETVENYAHPSKADRRGIEKTLLKKYPEYYHLQEVYAGIILNEESPDLIIAYRKGKTFDLAFEEVHKTLRKEFRKGTFSLYDLDVYFDELPPFLEELVEHGLIMRKGV